MDASSKFQDSLPTSSDALLARLAELDIDYVLYHHVPLRTVEDSKQVEDSIIAEGEAAFRTKNFYLRDRKKRNYLVTLEQDRPIDLKALGRALGVGNLSFGSAERLLETLGVRPGAVSPLAMVNGARKEVRFILDPLARQSDRLYLHPLVNDRTISISLKDLTRFFESIGVEINWLPEIS